MKDSNLKIGNVVEMGRFASEVAGELGAGDVLLLSGPLGSGKTTFVQGLAKALGVKEKVTSPTFTIASEYKTAGNSKIDKLTHIDLYRFSEGEADKDPVVWEALESGSDKGVVVIEWADRLEGPDFRQAKMLRFAYGDGEGERVVGVKSKTKKPKAKKNYG